jgi:hypothetical protein
MHILILMLCLIAALALDCEQNYVRVYHPVEPGDNLSQAYTDLVNVVTGRVNFACIASDVPLFDDPSTCWNYTTPPNPTQNLVCGFRIWRAYKQCDFIVPFLVDELNWAFYQSLIQSSTYIWIVHDTQPSGDVHCG